MQSTVLITLTLVVALCGFAARLSRLPGQPAIAPVPPGPRPVRLECIPDDRTPSGSAGADRPLLTYVRDGTGGASSGIPATAQLLCHIVN